MVQIVQIEQMIPQVSRLRSITSQVLSSLSSNFLLLSILMAATFPTIALPALLNAREGLSLNDVQASWFGSVSPLVHFLGALFAGPIADYFGRKRACFLVNFPVIFAWILIYFAWNVRSLLIANALLGLGAGIMEAPVVVYVGEIRFMYKFRYVLLSKETLRPLIFTIAYFWFSIMSGYTPIQPNLVNICGAFGMAQDGNTFIIYVSIITTCTTILVIILIGKVGKRKMAISAMFGTAITCAALSVYARKNLNDSVFSYDTTTFPKEQSYIPLILFYSFVICTGFNIPWVLLGEVFPFRSRASAQCISVACFYVFTFIGTKTLLDLETHIRLWGTFAVYAAFGFLGTIFLYFFLPETEGMILEDIEVFFNSDKIQTFANDPVINKLKRLTRRNHSK